MTAADDLARQALELAEEAVRALTSVVTEASLEDLTDAEGLLISDERSGEAEGDGRMKRWIRLAAMELLHAARTDPHEDDEQEHLKALETAAWRAIDVGDFAPAQGLAEDLLRLATDEEDWNYGNLIHDAHILIGYARMLDGDIKGAVEALAEAGSTPGSPQLDSFGPDLSLAWELMKRGEQGAALGYFQAVSRFWSPHRPN